jgi:hypothetical protein
LYLHTRVHIFLHHIRPPTPFPTTSSPHWCHPTHTCSALLFSDFVEEKEKQCKSLTSNNISSGDKNWKLNCSVRIVST